MNSLTSHQRSTGSSFGIWSILILMIWILEIVVMLFLVSAMVEWRRRTFWLPLLTFDFLAGLNLLLFIGWTCSMKNSPGPIHQMLLCVVTLVPPVLFPLILFRRITDLGLLWLGAGFLLVCFVMMMLRPRQGFHVSSLMCESTEFFPFTLFKRTPRASGEPASETPVDTNSSEVETWEEVSEEEFLSDSFTDLEEANSNSESPTGFSIPDDNQIQQSFVRSRDREGNEQIEGEFRILLDEGELITHHHLPLVPNLQFDPEVTCYVLDGSHVKVRVAAAYPYGVRFELKRTSSNPCETVAHIGFQIQEQTPRGFSTPS